MDGGLETVVVIFVIATGILYAVFSFLPLMYNKDYDKDKDVNKRYQDK